MNHEANRSFLIAMSSDLMCVLKAHSGCCVENRLETHKGKGSETSYESITVILVEMIVD